MVLVYWVELGPNMVARRVDSEMRHTINRKLAEAGIAIPYPQRDVHLDLALPLPVSVVTQKDGG
jgi:small-conductance mechanosensitive channel